MKQFNWKEIFQEAKVKQPIYYALSGSHLYGFNSPDSDMDIRGCHSEPLYEVLGLDGGAEVRRKTMPHEIDFESFDIRKELKLIMANNSNVMEHLASIPIYKSKYFSELKSIAEKSICKLIARPYWGMAQQNLHKYLLLLTRVIGKHPLKNTFMSFGRTWQEFMYWKRAGLNQT